MSIVKSFLGNPILEPQASNSWESQAAFNGCPIKVGNRYAMLYRALGPAVVDGQTLSLSSIGLATGSSKTDFTSREQFIYPKYQWEKFGCEDPRVTKIDDEYFIFYTAISNNPPGLDSIKVALALSPDLKTITEKKLVTPFNAKAMTLFPAKINGDYAALFTYGTETGESSIAFARFPKKTDIWNPEFWRNWSEHRDHHLINLSCLNTDRVEIGAPPVEIPQGWLVIYSHIQNYYSGSPVLGIEAVVLDRDDPTKILLRTQGPFMIPQEDYELQGMVPNAIFPSGCLLENDHLYIYYGAADTTVALSVTTLPELLGQMVPVAHHRAKLIKYQNNPILKPNQFYSWQSKAVFNPTVFHYQDKFHLIYRAMGQDNTSVLGYATSTDGYNIDYLHPTPVYLPRLEFESKRIPGANSGCEDPRATVIGDKLYLVYTAYDSVNPPRIALTSILLSDFIAQRFDNWATPKLITEPGVDDKDGCLLPEKVDNKFVFFHRPGGKGMCIDCVDNLDFDHGDYLKSDFCISLNLNNWDNLKTGIAGTPIKTKKGWLVFYHALNKIDHYYRVGCLLLDLTDMKKIIGKVQTPILEPEQPYERQGQISNVVFPCGQVVVDNRLFVYYGAADTTIGVATIGIEQLLDSIVYTDF